MKEMNILDNKNEDSIEENIELGPENIGIQYFN